MIGGGASGTQQQISAERDTPVLAGRRILESRSMGRGE